MGYGAYENLRKDYDKFSLIENELSQNPFAQFQKWFDEAKESGIEEANAMGLSTVDSNGIPSSRIVLLKGLDENGFTFYSNYESQKGSDIDKNPNVSLLFFWDKLHRQVRVNGSISKLPREKSVEYFNGRPYESRIGALASAQSEIAKDRAEIEHQFEKFKMLYPTDPPCPPNWGGYLVKPNRIEFWQGRSGRLHDRLVFSKLDSVWEIKRLYP